LANTFIGRNKIKDRGGDHKSNEFKIKSPTSGFDSKSAQQTAKLLGIGKGKVEDAYTVLDDEQARKAVKEGKSVHAAAKESRERKKETRVIVFNETNDNIEWAKWTWNPVTGCEHGCPYCYARDIANRFYPHGFEPHFYPERLVAPQNTKIPNGRKDEPGINNVFLVSMGDLLGKWVPENWIFEILESVEKSPEWNFLILTKNPQRYLEFTWPDNCWLGATADNQQRMNIALEVFSMLDHPIKFLSCEPLMEKITLFTSTKNIVKIPIHWIIIGGRSKSTGMNEGQPKWEWVESLLDEARSLDIKVYFKPNLTIRPKEYPNA